MPLVPGVRLVVGDLRYRRLVHNLRLRYGQFNLDRLADQRLALVPRADPGEGDFVVGDPSQVDHVGLAIAGVVIFEGLLEAVVFAGQVFYRLAGELARDA